MISKTIFVKENYILCFDFKAFETKPDTLKLSCLKSQVLQYFRITSFVHSNADIKVDCKSNEYEHRKRALFLHFLLDAYYNMLFYQHLILFSTVTKSKHIETF